MWFRGVLRVTHLSYLVDGTERQIIKDLDGNMPRPKIRACSICDPFVLVIREDDSIGLFIGETTGKIRVRRKDMSPMGDKVKPERIVNKSYFLHHNVDLSLPCRMFLYRYHRNIRHLGQQ